MSKRLHVKYSCRILIKPEVSRQILEKKKTQISSFIKIRPMGVELFRAGGRTDMTKLIIGFRNYANTPLKEERNGQTREKRIAGN
jgi:hypothetical protein